MECTSEAPGNISVIIQCTGNVVYNDITLVEYAKKPLDITGSVPVPLYEQCTITVVFSNGVGNSEPFILTFGKYILVNVCVLFITLSYRHYYSHNESYTISY